MKIKVLLSLLFLVSIAGVCFSQSVVITPKKTVYRRPKPKFPDKRTFTIRYPRVSGLAPALNKKVQSEISYERVFKLNPKEELRLGWLVEAYYKINYNKKGILNITLTVYGEGAYPSDYSKTVVVNLKTGRRLTAQDAFTNLNDLVAMCKKAQKAEIKKALTENKENDIDESLFKETDFKVENLKDFSVSDTGITFIYDYGFPHVALALQPEGRYFFTWRQMKPFIRSDGLLHQFVP